MENQQAPQAAPSSSSKRSLRGFASMDRSKQKEIASKGGRAAHEKGTAHEFDSGEASMAAKKGHQRGTAHEFTTDEARLAGRKGGMARAANRNRQQPNAETAGQRSEMQPAAGHHNPSESRREGADGQPEMTRAPERAQDRPMDGGQRAAQHNPS